MILKKLGLAFLLTVFIAMASGCGGNSLKEEDLTEFHKLEWMLGIWEGKQGNADIYESWRKKNYRIMEGISYTTVDGRRVYAQTMRIEQSNNNIFLIIKFNEGDENEFSLAAVDNEKVVFKNTEDGKFPETVTYYKEPRAQMSVLIKGDNADAESTSLSYTKTSDV